MIFGMTYYQICSYFLLYSFLGWVVEVVFHAAHQGKIVNRGFLNGPVCPVYGFGMIVMLMLVKGVSPASSEETTNVFVLFMAGLVLCTAIELFAGFALDKLFHMRWWDYSKEPFNLNGYICLKFSLLWGAGSAFVVGMIQPLVRISTASLMPESIGWWVMAFLYVVYLVDFIITVSTIIGLNKRLKEIDALRASIRDVSDDLTEAIGTTTMTASEKLEASGRKVEALKENAIKAKDSVADSVNVRKESAIMTAKLTKDKMEGMVNSLRSNFALKRLMKAFPKMESRISKETISRLRGEYEQEEAERRRNAAA